MAVRMKFIVSVSFGAALGLVAYDLVAMRR
jgi:hypothetical protein